ncbi:MULTISPECIES: hypothetical protein [Hungatella]|uniref:hypothetical protein n=1 Tax=Hungatella TaxID=1649459 RepID=UPI000412D366|nr:MULTISPECIES: hypothetical protein [Hungatella]
MGTQFPFSVCRPRCGVGLAAAAVVMMAVTGWFKNFVQERRVPEWLTGKRK